MKAHPQCLQTSCASEHIGVYFLADSVPEATSATGWEFHLTPNLVTSNVSKGCLPAWLRQNWNARGGDMAVRTSLRPGLSPLVPASKRHERISKVPSFPNPLGEMEGSGVGVGVPAMGMGSPVSAYEHLSESLSRPKNKLTLVRPSQWAWLCPEHFTYMNYFNSHHNHTRQVLLLCPFYSWGNWGIERWGDLPKITQTVSGRVWNQAV